MTMRNLSTDVKLTYHSLAVAAGLVDEIPATAIDMANFDACLFIVAMGPVTVGGTYSIQLQQSSDAAGSPDNFSIVAGTGVSINATTGGDKLYYIDIVRPTKQFLKCVVKRATQNATINGIVAIQYRAAIRPPTHATNVGGGELHAEKAEGGA